MNSSPLDQGLRYPSRLGPTLRAHRERLGKTQQEIADAINRSQHAVSRIEKNGPDTPPPTAEVLNPWAKALGVPVVELLRAAGYQIDEDVDVPVIDELVLLEMIQRASGLTTDSRRALENVVRLAFTSRPAAKESE